MRQIRFGSTVFDLVSMPNIHVDRMQATILKGANSVESIANAANNAESVAILEDGEVVGIYDDYNILITAVLRKDQEIDIEGTLADTVSVELRNRDIQAQIVSLDNSLDHVKSTQSSQGARIANLDAEVSTKLDAGVVGDVETIGAPSSKAYSEGNLFMGSDGTYYKATTEILVGSILAIGGNCEATSVSAEIAAE